MRQGLNTLEKRLYLICYEFPINRCKDLTQKGVTWFVGTEDEAAAYHGVKYIVNVNDYLIVEKEEC